MPQSSRATTRLHVERIGGIDSTKVIFNPGVSILTGRNATNRTSLLQAMMAVLGSRDVTLKGDADKGSVRLTTGGGKDRETYTRTLRRENGSIAFDGEPYLDGDGVEVADLFAFLLESNEVRQSVARREDLRDLIMRPVDTDAIRADIDRLVEERRSVNDRLDELDSLETRRGDLESRREQIRENINTARTKLQNATARVERLTPDIEDPRDQDAVLEEQLSDLQEIRSDLEEVRFELEAERDSLDALRSEREELERELQKYPETPTEDINAIDAELDELRERRRSKDAELTELQRTIQFNETRIEDAGPPPVEADTAEATSAVAEQPGEDVQRVVCWTCGSEVAKPQIEATLDHLRTLRDDRQEERREVQNRIDELSTQRIELEEQRRQRTDITDQLDDIETECDKRLADIEKLENRQNELRPSVEEIESQIGDFENQNLSELLEHQRKVNRLELRIDQLTDNLSEIRAEIAEIEERLAARPDLKARRSSVQTKIESLRTQIAEIERTAVAEFNDHMDQMLEILDYTNLERIWIERQEADTDGGRSSELSTGTFELHVMRTTSDDTTYEDTAAHLSESEREVTGLVFAFAGYLVHEVHDRLPFMLLDSLEAIDSDRLSDLISYLRPYNDYLIVALLPEDAGALPDSYQRITDI